MEAFDLLCEVQSDKASVEITSPFDGVIKELLVKEGEIAKVGSGLCLIEVDEADVEAESSPAEPRPAPQEPKPQPQSEVEAPPSPAPTRTLHPLDPKGESTSASSSKTGRGGSEVLATPSIRHFAKQRGVNLAELAPGSGRGGRVEKRDIEAFLEAGVATPQQAGATSAVPRPGETNVELNRTRLAMWKAMTKVSFSN